jgi:pyruvate/2-oxoglutarate dehydrogenase complex dihydrolipoamide dehydrogenase (E3) component
MRIIKANFIEKTDQPVRTVDRMVPYLVYMNPQLGHVGLYEFEAWAQFPGKTI